MENDNNKVSSENMRERLIIAGISEIEKYGITGFSLRKVASKCNLSCAAPYKYFNDKNDFILEILRYINSKWDFYYNEVKKSFNDDPARQLTEIIVSYIRFLYANPDFRSIIMMSGNNMDKDQIAESFEISHQFDRLICEYCEKNDSDKTKVKYKSFLLRSLIYGSSLMLDTNQIDNSKESFDMIYGTINMILKF